MEMAVVAGAVVVAVVAWLLLFGGRRDDIWPRTWVVAGALIIASAIALVSLGRLGEVIGPVGPPQLLAGAGVGVAWLVATHVGHAVLCRLFPSFVEQVRDLYGLGADEPARRVLGPILAMALAEELLFRGVVHTLAGFAAGVAVYGAVQVIERKWVLVLAAVLGGIVWGGLYEWTGGIVAPFVAHAIWTASLTLVWPLGDERDGDGVSPGTRAARA
jgi:membrane protease YdiL (CAAX protease family)